MFSVSSNNKTIVVIMEKTTNYNLRKMKYTNSVVTYLFYLFMYAVFIQILHTISIWNLTKCTVRIERSASFTSSLCLYIVLFIMCFHRITWTWHSVSSYIRRWSQYLRSCFVSFLLFRQRKESRRYIKNVPTIMIFRKPFYTSKPQEYSISALTWLTRKYMIDLFRELFDYKKGGWNITYRY